MADFPAPAPLLDPDEPPSPAPVVSDAEIGAARLYVEASRAASTRRAYHGDWTRFLQWCDERGAPCPARCARPGRGLPVRSRRGGKSAADGRPCTRRDRPLSTADSISSKAATEIS